MAQPTEPSRLRRYMGGVRPGAAVGGAMLGAVNAANEVNDVRTNYGQAAANEAAPGIAAGNIAGGAAFAAEPPRMLQRGVSRALGAPGMREFAKSAANTLEAAPKPPAGASVKLGGLRSTLQRGVMPTLRQAAGRTAGNLVGGTLRRTPGTVAVYGVAKGVADSFVDNNTGYADEYAKQMGMDDSAAGVIGASVLRTVENVGNAATGGYAARLGQGIGSALGGGSFSEGWNQTPAREAFYEKRRMEQAAAAGKRPPGAPIDIKFRDESTPPDSFYKNPAPPAKKPETPEARAQAAAAAEQAARIDAPPERATAYGFQDANKAEAAGMRSAARIQDYGANARSTITGNALDGLRGDTNELMRRMQNDLTSYQYKGFPGLRAARAEMWNNLINGANGVTAKGADNAAAADMQGMQDANESQRAFSDRKSKVNMFNVGTSEERRAGDLDRQARLIASTLGGGMRRRGEDPQTYAGIAKGFGGDYTAAAQSVLRNKAAAGEDLTDDPLATMALTNLSDEVLAGNGRMARRGIAGTTIFGAGADGPVDPNPLNYTRQERGFFDRLGSAVLPWGTKASDYLYVDKAGNKHYRDTPLFSDDPVLDEQIRARIAAGMGYKE